MPSPIRFHITTTAALFGSRQELVVLHNQGGNMVYWILTVAG